MAHILQTSIEYLKGVGPQRAEVLQKELGIFTYADLLQHYPFRYVDRSQVYKVSDLNPNTQYIQLRGVIRGFRSIPQKRGSRLVAEFVDDTGSVELIWFQGAKWIQKNLKAGVEYLLFGKPNVFRGQYSIPHPEMELVTQATLKDGKGLEPVYSSTDKLRKKGLDTKGIQKLVRQLFTVLKPNHLAENLPEHLLNSMRLPGRWDSLHRIHFPQEEKQLSKVQFRLKFEEFFMVQLRLLKIKLNRHEVNKGFVFEKIDGQFDKFFHDHLPFELTGAQKRVLKEIRVDTLSGKQMNRLLQGDVGSGKTVVSLMTMLMAIDNGYQACIMAPTEILAQQHLESIRELLKGMGLKVALLTGSVKGAQRKQLLTMLAQGDLDIVIGTHALIEDKVVFKNLGMVVIDEQHRFGVAQRAKLWAKNEHPPHILVMTATPIPRTLAMTLYGDLDVSVIDELPPGRKPIQTIHRNDSYRLRVFGFMKEQIQLGRQIYVVYPLIQESEKMDFKDLMDGYESISRAFPEYQISIVHGKMKPADKEHEMQRFASGQTQIMVATTVIEVGVNVPNASVMVIESAERFGLSQLHQLRGRVGRGADQSYCILMTGVKLSNDSKKRINIMCQTNDGFKIAEADLMLRGPGDIEGTRQSGDVALKLASLTGDQAILKMAREAAEVLLTDDPYLQKESNAGLRQYLLSYYKDQTIWSRIS